MASTRKKRNLYEDYLQNVPLLKVFFILLLIGCWRVVSAYQMEMH
jgi:hypothetical protein